MKKISRSEALAQGLPRYFTGGPCKHGHISERYTSHKRCVQCAHERNTSAYAKQYNRVYAKQNAEKAQERAKRWFADNTERAYASRRKYAATNQDVMRKSREKWRKDNLSHCAALAAKRRGSKLQATPIWITSEHNWMFSEIYALAHERSKVTGITWHVDHIVPLQSNKVCGLHVPWNLRVITQAENQSKGNRFTPADGIANGDFSNAA